MHKFILILFSILVLFSCATKIKTQVTFPARSVGATDVHVIAVLPFNGNSGNLYMRDAETILKNIKVGGKEYFTIIDRNNISSVITEQNFQMHLADQDTIAELGKIIGAEGVYTGSIHSSTSDSFYKSSRSKCIKKENKKCTKYHHYKVTCTERIATFKFQPKLIDVSTTRVLFSQTYETQASDNRCSDSSFTLDSQSDLTRKASYKAFEMFRKDVAPYTETVSLELMEDTKALSKKEKEIFEGAIEFAKAGRMDRSCELWNGIENRKSVDLIHNIGLCYEISGKLDDAEKQYRAADRLLIKPDDTINSALARIMKLKSDRERLKAQLH